jgi:L-lactate utilization protein LutB
VKDGNVGLLGVNAVSAESGSIYLVQHLHNITKIIEASNRLIFVVGLEKLLGSDSEAGFQAKCCGLFGLDNILEELFTRKTDPEVKPPAKIRSKVKKTELRDESFNFSLPSELHIIILDNGRSDLIGSKFQSLLECIGCKACSRLCPRVRQGPGSDLELPTNPRDILLSGFTKGLDFAAEHGLFECTTCGNCENLCPVDIPLPDLTLQMRELCTKVGLVPASHKRISENIEARGNPYLSV